MLALFSIVCFPAASVLAGPLLQAEPLSSTAVACSCGEVPPSFQSCPFADFGTSPSELVSFGMKAPRDSFRELKRLEEATRRDSRHFVQCSKCRVRARPGGTRKQRLFGGLIVATYIVLGLFG